MGRCLDEFGFIRHITEHITCDSSVVKGPGDDCAVIQFTGEKYLLMTCDMIVEGVDFTPRDPPELIGRKALAVSLSDIAACAGVPRYAVVSLGSARAVPVSRLKRVAAGLLRCAREYRVNIVGGDISSAPGLTIDVSVVGIVEKENLVLRSGAKKGDIIFVTGPLGGSLRGKHLRFIPRIKEARWLVQQYKVNAMIDISDGLSQDLGHILSQSRVGATLYEELIPVAKEARNLQSSLQDGEDFELLFTLAPSYARRLLANKKQQFFPIGEITDAGEGFRLIDRHSREKKIKPQGYRHFS